VSEVVGIALLFGFIVAGAALVVVTGTTAQERLSEQSRYEAAISSVGELDAALSDLSVGDDSTAASVTVTERVGDGESVWVDTDDELTIQFDDGGGFTGACEATVPLDRVDYEVTDGTVVSYQAGGVFVTQAGTTVVDTPPDVGLTEGTVKGSVFDLPADLDHEFTASRDVEGSVTQTRQALANLFATPGCARPDGVRLTVESTRADGWERHFESSLGDVDGVTVSTPAPDEVAVEMPQDVLVDAVNDSRNGVVAFNESGTPGTVSVNGSGVDIAVDKPVDNEYGVTVRRLGGDVGVNATSTFEDWQWDNETVPGPDADPIDVVYVMDESGSMSGQQLTDTKEGVTSFTDVLIGDTNNTHRAALVGYSGDGATTYQSLTASLDDVKSATSSLSASGGTSMDAGMNTGMDELPSPDPATDRSQVVIVMTDGQPDGGEGPYDPDCTEPLGGSVSGSEDCPVAEAIQKGYTVYTVTFGEDGDVDKNLMQNVASDTGGGHEHVYPGNGDDLDDAFGDLVGGDNGWVEVPNKEYFYVTEYRAILHQPVTLTHTHDGTTWGDDGATPVQNAVHEEYGGTVEAPGRLQDGETLTASATRHSCDVDNSSHRSLVNERLPYQDTVYDVGKEPYNESAQGDWAAYYNEYTCTDGTTTPVGDANRSFYAVDGDSTSKLTDGDSPVGWQREVEEIVDPYTSGGTVDLQSNQVIVVYEFDDQGDHDTNGLVVLYEVGYSTDLEVGQVLDLDVTEIEEGT